jgi:hypothetical protein
MLLQLVDEVRAGDLVLVKGSRGVQTDKVISALRQRFALVGEERNSRKAVSGAARKNLI